MVPSLRSGDRLLVRKTGRIDYRVGDIVLLKGEGNGLVAHRLVKALPGARWVTKGDSLLRPDPAPADLSRMAGRVEAIVRGRRLIRLSSGLRSNLARLYSILSTKNLMPGALRLRAKHALMTRVPSAETGHPDVEREFLTAVLRGLAPGTVKVPRNMNWGRFLDFACREGLAGIVYSRVKEASIPADVLSTFKNLYLNIAARNFLNLKALEEMEQGLRGEPVEIMTLKGASLIDRVYPGMGMRPMSDLDLMVRNGDRARIEDLLSDLGYRRDPRIQHLYERNNVTIDLHVHALNTDRIANRSSLFPSGMEPIWENSLPWKDGFSRLRRPDDVDNVLLLSQHLMKHSFSGLIWLMDIHELLKGRDGEFWARLSHRADQLKQRKVVFYPLYLLKRVFGFEPPAGTGFECQAAALSRLERALLDSRTRGESMERMGVILAFLCIDGTVRRIAFLRETLFPGRKVVREEFRTSAHISRAWFYGFRLLEAGRVISKQLRTVIALLVRGSP